MEVQAATAPVELIGDSTQYTFVPVTVADGTTTLTCTQVYYFPLGEPALADPTSGQLIGDLYRVTPDDISLTGEYVTGVVTSQISSVANGQMLQIDIMLSNPITVNTDSGHPTLLLGDPVIATYDQNASRPGEGLLVFDYVPEGESFNDLRVTGFNLNGASISGIRNAAADLSSIVNFDIGISVNSPLLVQSVAASQIGEIAAGQSVTLTLTMNEGLSINSAGGIRPCHSETVVSRPTTQVCPIHYLALSCSIIRWVRATRPAVSKLRMSLYHLARRSVINRANADFSNALNVDTDIEIGTQTIPPTVSILTSGGLTNQAS